MWNGDLTASPLYGSLVEKFEHLQQAASASAVPVGGRRGDRTGGGARLDASEIVATGVSVFAPSETAPQAGAVAVTSAARAKQVVVAKSGKLEKGSQEMDMGIGDEMEAEEMEDEEMSEAEMENAAAENAAAAGAAAEDAAGEDARGDDAEMGDPCDDGAEGEDACEEDARDDGADLEDAEVENTRDDDDAKAVERASNAEVAVHEGEGADVERCDGEGVAQSDGPSAITTNAPVTGALAKHADGEQDWTEGDGLFAPTQDMVDAAKAQLASRRAAISDFDRTRAAAQEDAGGVGDENADANAPAAPLLLEIVGSTLPRKARKLLQHVARTISSDSSGNAISITFAKDVSSTTTHVVTTAVSEQRCKRTIKFFLGLAHGTWIVSSRWLQACSKAGHLVSEEDYAISCGLKDDPNSRGPERARDARRQGVKVRARRRREENAREGCDDTSERAPVKGWRSLFVPVIVLLSSQFFGRSRHLHIRTPWN